MSVGQRERAAARRAVTEAVDVALLFFVLVLAFMLVFVLVLVFVLLLLFLVLMVVVVVMVVVLGGGRGRRGLLSEGLDRRGWHGHNDLLHDRRLSTCGRNRTHIFFP